MSANSETGLQPLMTELHDAAQTVWQRYQEAGPGRVEVSLYDRVETAAVELLRFLTDENSVVREDSVTELNDAAETLRDLCKRCCFRPEGLCFVTGEAGLIPRRDLHENFERALRTLAGNR